MLVEGRAPFRCVNGAGRNHKTLGFTLIELVVTLSVMAILATLATPSFREFIVNQRLRNASFDLMAALMLARSEAITRNGNVDLVRRSTAWDAGWTVSTATSTLLDQQAYKGLSITDSASFAKITYGKDGRALTAPTRFTIAPSTTLQGVNPRCISIGLGGMPSSKAGAC